MPEQSFLQNLEALLSLDPEYAPWNSERHDPAEYIAPTVVVPWITTPLSPCALPGTCARAIVLPRIERVQVAQSAWIGQYC